MPNDSRPDQITGWPDEKRLKPWRRDHASSITSLSLIRESLALEDHRHPLCNPRLPSLGELGRGKMEQVGPLPPMRQGFEGLLHGGHRVPRPPQFDRNRVILGGLLLNLGASLLQSDRFTDIGGQGRCLLRDLRNGGEALVLTRRLGSVPLGLATRTPLGSFFRSACPLKNSTAQWCMNPRMRDDIRVLMGVAGPAPLHRLGQTTGPG